MPYPDEIDSFTDPVAGQPLNSPSQSGITAKIHSALVAVQTALGLNPQGSATDVAERISDGFGFRQVLVFPTSDTFTKADFPWLRAIRAKVVGGGGGGGRAVATAANASAGDGGGAGGYAEALINVEDLLSSESIVVGAGGVAADGAASSFGAHAAASGGTLGSILTAGTAPAFNTAANLGGVGTVGDILISGGRGLNGAIMSSVRAVGGTGGDSVLGHGGVGRGSGGSGSPGTGGRGFGGGGGGSANSQSQSELSGGDGMSGVVILELYG